MSNNSKDIEMTARIIYDAIFQDRATAEINGIVYPIKKTSKSKVRLIELDDLTYIEQNPYKSSQWAKEAQEGHQIMWIMQGRRYLARIRDGTFMNLQKK
jgi:hypothetical protein